MAGAEVICGGPSRRSRRRLGRAVDVDEAQIAVGGLGGGLLAGKAAVDEALERIAPDRAADCEPDIGPERGGLTQPMIDLVVACSPAQHYTCHAVAPASPALGCNALAVGALVQTLDLPDVGLHPSLLQMRDRENHQVRAQLRA